MSKRRRHKDRLFRRPCTCRCQAQATLPNSCWYARTFLGLACLLCVHFRCPAPAPHAGHLQVGLQELCESQVDVVRVRHVAIVGEWLLRWQRTWLRSAPRCGLLGCRASSKLSCRQHHSLHVAHGLVVAVKSMPMNVSSCSLIRSQ